MYNLKNRMKKLSIISILVLIGLVAPALFVKIQAANGSPTIPGLTVIAPNGGEQWPQNSSQTIKWKTGSSSIAYVNISINPYISCLHTIPACSLAQPAPITIASNVPYSQGFYYWTIGANINQGAYTLTIADAQTGLSSSSADVFYIAPISISIIAPNGGEQWPAGSSQIIKWTAPSSVSSVNIGFSGGCPNNTACPASFNIIANNVPDTGSYTWSVPLNSNPGQYTVFINDVAGSASGKSAVQFSITSATTNTVRVGANVLMNGTVYYVAPAAAIGVPENPPPQPTLRPYTSAAVFLSYGINAWSTVVPISVTEAALKISDPMFYAEDTLINDNGTVYLATNGNKCGITSANLFISYGYKWSSVINGDTNFMPSFGCSITSANLKHFPGSLVNINGTIYYIGDIGRGAFPSIKVFNSWGFKLSNVVPANNEDIKFLTGAGDPLTIIGPWTPGMPLTPALLTNIAILID